MKTIKIASISTASISLDILLIVIWVLLNRIHHDLKHINETFQSYVEVIKCKEKNNEKT